MAATRCSDCQDGRHCRHTGDVAATTVAMLLPCRCPDCNPHPIQARLFSAALVEADLGDCADCGQPATKLLVGGAGQPDVSLCESCEHRRYLRATGGHDHAAGQLTAHYQGLPPRPRPTPAS